MVSTYSPKPQLAEQVPQAVHCDNTQSTGQQLWTQSLLSEVAGHDGAQ